MKTQYYADSRDVAKWTILLRLAKMHGLRSIVQIAMLTADDTTTHGGQQDDPENGDPAVRRFFTEERESLATDPQRRSISRVQGLGKELDPPVSIEVITEPFQHRSRATYFQVVVGRLLRLDHPALAFLDPDVGIALRGATEKHVTEAELKQVWQALRSGSVLSVFQYEQRRRGWRDKATEALVRVLGVSQGEVVNFPYRRVSFLSVVKTDGSPADLRNLVRRAWNGMADAYDAAVGTPGDFYRTEVIGPSLLAACGNVQGLRVLDLGCGQGYFARLLAQAGARVVGVDISERMITHARRREAEDSLGIDYVALDAAEIAGHWPSGRFDMTVSCIAFQDMPEPYRVLAGIRAVTRPDGHVILLVEHPIQTSAYREWERDAGGRKIALRLDRYFDSGYRHATWKIDLPSARRQWFQFPTFGRTLEEWSRLFAETGFMIARLLEPRPTREQVERIPELDDCFRIPYFLIFHLEPRHNR